MISRRNALLLGLATTFRVARADETLVSDASIVPNEVGHADFAAAWDLTEPGTIALVGAAPDVPPGIAEKFAQTIFHNADEIDGYFIQQRQNKFITWFNSAVANKGNWIGKSCHGPNLHENFVNYWNAYLASSPRTLMEFIVYMSVFINECDGNLLGSTERFGNAQHKGISYLFDTVVIAGQNGRVWRKQSYNTGKGNMAAGVLFNDANFNLAHKEFALATALSKTQDKTWWGDIYPQQSMPTSADDGADGYILQCDFFKFRGRGLIQTTWRSNYRSLVDFVQRYEGESEVINRYKSFWKKTSLDLVCTTSTSSQWDEIFADPSRAILGAAVRLHARDGNYLPLGRNVDDINGILRGSIDFFGDRLGGTGYGRRLKARVVQICEALI